MEKIFIIEYKLIDGIPTLSDSQIKHLYEKLVEDGIVGNGFNSDIDPATYTSEDFLEYCTYNCKLFVVAERHQRIVGLAFVEKERRGVAVFHFLVFREYWGKSIDIGKYVVGQFLKKYETLVGFIPATNSRALNFVRKLGFKFSGQIENGFFLWKDNKYVNTVVVYMTQESTDESN